MNQAGDFLRDRFIERRDPADAARLPGRSPACRSCSPFIGPMLWGIIITVATWHPYRWLADDLGGRRIAGRGDRVAGTAADPGRADLAAGRFAGARASRAVAGLMRDLTTIAAARAAGLAARSAGVGSSLDEQWREAMVDLPASLSAAAALYRHRRRLRPLHRRRARRRDHRVPGRDRDRGDPAGHRRGGRAGAAPLRGRGSAASTT